MPSSFPAGELVVGVLSQLAITGALGAWGEWVARRMGNHRFWRFARWSPWFSLCALFIGTLVAVFLLVRGFGVVSSAQTSASQRQALLAQSISHAMKVSAIFLLVGYGLLMFAVVTFIVGSVRRIAPTSERASLGK